MEFKKRPRPGFYAGPWSSGTSLGRYFLAPKIIQLLDFIAKNLVEAVGIEPTSEVA